MACALTVVTVAASSSATTPAENGLIAFARYRLQDNPLWSEIYVAKPDGTDERQVSRSPTAVEDEEPRWSPDGKWIVFARCTTNGPCALWLVRPDGTGQRRLSPPCPASRQQSVCRDDRTPSFAPDGRHIVFTHEWGRVKQTSFGDQIEHSAIAAVDLAGRHLTILRQLAPYAGDFYAPMISPNGKLIVFDRYNAASVRPAGGDALFVTRMNGGSSRRLTPWRLSAGSPDWSPDGKQVLFKQFIPDRGELSPRTNLYTVGVNGTGLRRVTNVGSSHYALAGSFSPDGTSIVFATDSQATANPHAPRPSADIFTMRTDGTNVTPITRTANLDGWPAWGPAGS
jgi:TolB protein